MENNADERLEFILKHLGLTPHAFSRSTGVGRQTVQNIQRQKELGRPTKITLKTANKIKAVYPQFSREWMTDGRGKPFVPGMENFTTLAQRFKMIMDHYHHTREKMAAILDISVKGVEDIVDKNINPHPSLIKIILEAFPEVRDEWLIKGKGEMVLGFGNNKILLREAIERIQEYLKREA